VAWVSARMVVATQQDEVFSETQEPNKCRLLLQREMVDADAVRVTAVPAVSKLKPTAVTEATTLKTLTTLSTCSWRVATWTAGSSRERRRRP